jgi:hypothetical protein
VEPLLILLLLYALQCAVLLPRGGALFLRLPWRWRPFQEPGWNVLHPLPSAASVLATRLPLLEDERGLRAREVPTRLGRAPLRAEPPRLDLAGGSRIEVRGKWVRVDGRAFARAVTARRAEWLGTLLRELRGASPDAIRARLRQELAESLSLERFREASDRFRRTTRLLAWSSDLYAAGLFVGLPLLVWRVHSERALLLFFPVFLLLHGAVLAALVLAHRKLDPGARGELVEALIAAALYPPLLLRAVGELRLAALGGFHPATAAAALLPDEERRRFLRVELARLTYAADARAPRDRLGVGLADLEREALAALAAECGLSAEELLAPLPQDDPAVPAYCPICLSDYLRPTGECSDCRVALVPYAGG